MRRPTAVIAAVALLLLGGACSDDDGREPATSTTAAATTSTTLDPALEALLLAPADLPGTFTVAPDTGLGGQEVATSLCATQNPIAGLSATALSLVQLRRDPAGAAVGHFAIRFVPGDAQRFVEQTAAALDACDEVPGLTGLAFDYEPTSDEVEAVLAPAAGHVARYGTQIGSESAREDVAVFRVGDVGHLVTVVTRDADRAATDALAVEVYRAVVAKTGAAVAGG